MTNVMKLGKTDIVRISGNDELDRITDLLMDPEVEITGNLRHGAKRLSQRRAEGRESLRKYVYDLYRGWSGPDWQ